MLLHLLIHVHTLPHFVEVIFSLVHGGLTMHHTPVGRI